MSRLVFDRNWIAHAIGIHPFDDDANPVISLQIERFGNSLRAALRLSESIGTSTGETLKLNVGPTKRPFSHEGTFKRSRVSWQSSITQGSAVLTLQHRRRVWILKVEVEMDASVNPEPAVTVQLEGRWAEHHFIPKPIDE